MRDEDSARNAEIMLLSEQGMTNTAIAARFGITRQRVGAILSRQAQQQESWRIRELRASYADLQEEVKTPPAQHSAIGKTITDPETGKLVRNAGVKISAARERRLTLAQIAKEEQADGKLSEAEQAQMAAEIIAAFSELGAECDRAKREASQLRAEVADLKSRLAAYESADGQVIMPAEVVS